MSDPPDHCDLLQLLAGLILPPDREAALAQLSARGLLSGPCLDALRHELASPHYTVRNHGPLTAEVKVRIDNFLSRTPYSVFNTRVILARLREKLEFLEAPLNLQGKTILDFGSGRFATYTTALLLLANGARQVRLVEPSPILEHIALGAAKTFLADAMCAPEEFLLGDTAAPDFKQALLGIDLQHLFAHTYERCTCTRNLPEMQLDNSVDLIISTSVMEHVEDPLLELQAQKRALRPVGYAVHLIDLTDHRRTGNDFEFYYDGVMKGCNGLRRSDFERLFRQLELPTYAKRLSLSRQPVDYARVLPRFAQYEAEDLQIRGVTLIAQKIGKEG